MKKILLLIASVLFITSSVIAETKTASTGNWNTSGTWSPPGVPESDDDIVVPSGVLLTGDVATTVKSMDVQSGGFLLVNSDLTISGASSSDSTVSGNVTVNANLTFSAADLTVTGTISVSAGKQIIFSDTSSEIANSGTITLNSSSALFAALLYAGTDYSGAGSIVYKRYITAAATDWELLGSPVSGEDAVDIVGNTDLASSGDDFSMPESGVMGIFESNNSEHLSEEKKDDDRPGIITY